jgi:hypothetical protein
MQSTATPGLACLGGAVVTGAESVNVREVGFGSSARALVAGDKYMFVFGGDPERPGSRRPSRLARSARTYRGLPPIILGPTDQFLLALYSPSQSAAGVYKVRMGWTER